MPMWRNGEQVDFSDYCKERKDPTNNQLKILLEEVHGLCPIPGCGKSLVNFINDRVCNQYEIAHIFPCNPNDFQKLNLKDVQVDGDNSESLDNKIALCRDCHKIYDDNTTEVSYNQMLELKRKLAVELKAKKEISKVLIEDDIVKVISVLASMNKDDLDKSGNLEYKSLAISRKVEDYTLCSEIESKVTQYFNFVRDCFKRYDAKGDRFELICHSVKGLYLKLKADKLTQHEIYDTITDWFVSKTQGTRSSCSIMTSFFVQNCDIFDEISK